MKTTIEHPKYTAKSPTTPTITDYLDKLRQLNLQNLALLQENQRLRQELAQTRQLTAIMGRVTHNKVSCVSQSISITQNQELITPSISECFGTIGRELGGKDWALAGKMAGCLLEFYLETRSEKKSRAY